MTGCGYCDSFKEILKTENINFIDLDTELYPDIWKTVVKETNQDLVPTIFFKDNDDGDGVIYTPHVDYEDLDGLLNLIKKTIASEN